MSSPMRVLAEQHFKAASAEAALFEIRLRLRVGGIASAEYMAIDAKLSEVRDALIEHFKAVFTEKDVILLKNACTLRNKMLHCEFSTARKHLDSQLPKSRGGNITVLNVSNLDGRGIHPIKLQSSLREKMLVSNPLLERRQKHLKIYSSGYLNSILLMSSKRQHQFSGLR